MAPRGGGRGGGGGGGSHRGSGTVLNSPWSDPVHFRGSKFSDPVARGTIIILGICAFALLVIAIVAALIKRTATKKTAGLTRKTFAWLLYVSIIMAIIGIGSDLASAIIRDLEFVVERVYLLIEAILFNFNYLAEISLLAIVYWLLTVHFLRSSEPQKAKPTNFIRALGLIRYLFLLVLSVLCIGILYISVQYGVDVVKYHIDSKRANTLLDLDLAYFVLYLCATIEVLVWAVIAFRKRNTETRKLVIFLSLIAIPLLIRSFFSTGIAAQGLKHSISNVVAFIAVLITRVCTVLAYGGIVFIARQLENAQIAQLNGFAAPPPDPQNGYAPYQTQWQPGTQGPPPPGQQGYPTPGQGFNHPSPQMQGSPYTGNVAATSPSAPWAGQGNHPNGYAPVPQHNGGGGGIPDSHSAPVPQHY